MRPGGLAKGLSPWLKKTIVDTVFARALRREKDGVHEDKSVKK
jgi:hypothetical protein